MKIGILTYHNTRNCGAALQAYALQKKLASLGIDSEIIDYRCPEIEKTYRLKKIYDNKSIKELIKWFLTFKRNKRTQVKFDYFKNEYLNIGKIYDKTTISDANREYDAFITGSDQVWNMRLNGSDYTYLLDFVEKGKRRISYAASMGSAKPEEEHLEKFKSELSLFDFISVREKPLEKVIKECFGLESRLVLDPTLLLNKNDYNFGTNSNTPKEKYIFVYTVAPTPNIESAARKLSEETGFPIIWGHMSYKKRKGVKNVTDLSPAEFVDYIKNAEYVFTSSFHGMAMSIVFEKQFFYDLDRNVKNNNSRLETLAEILELQKQGVGDDDAEDFSRLSDRKINYTQVNRLLNVERNKAKAFLEAAF